MLLVRGDVMFRSRKFLVLAGLLLMIGTGLLAQVICQVGNLADPVFPPVTGVFQGDQIFAYLIHPVEQCACTEEFVQFQNVKMWLEFDPSMVPVNFIVQPGLRPAVYDPSIDRWVPDGYFYEGPEFQFEVMEPGPFLLQVPALNARWINIHDFFFLTLTFETPFAANLLCDDQDMPGIAYVSADGELWFDLYVPDKTSGGKPIIWGDVLCGADDGTGAPVPQAGPRLEQPYPNPFNPGTRVSLVLDRTGPVKLTVHDLGGHLVKVLADEQRDRGTWLYEWDGTDLRGRGAPAGLYFFRAETAGGVTVRKAALIK